MDGPPYTTTWRDLSKKKFKQLPNFTKSGAFPTASSERELDGRSGLTSKAAKDIQKQRTKKSLNYSN